MYEIYKIMKNDTLESIAKEYDTDVNNLLEILEMKNIAIEI